MTTQPAPKKAQQTLKLKLLPFAFPFLRKGQSKQGKSETSARFTDEHDIYRLLAEREPTGSYLVSRTGMWHGGIHITEAGAGQSLDLDAGVRCIADGHVIAYRIDRAYPVSEISATGNQALVPAPYSTGFTLVRHTMEFPKGTTLTFYSLYMHLMSYEDYANLPKREKPAYWPKQWRVTEFAQDKPLTGKQGQAAGKGQQGLRVRSGPSSKGNAIGILPQGATVSTGKLEKGWGQVKDVHGAELSVPVTGSFVSPLDAIGGWIYLGQENGGPLVNEITPEDSAFDRVIVTASAVCRPDDTEGAGIPIKAGELIGHLGRYDSLNQCTSGTRMVHLEVFCDDSIKSFIEQGRGWVLQHSPHKEDWDELGLPADPTILRIGPNTTLFQRNGDTFVKGADPQSRKTDVVQVYALAELGRGKDQPFTEKEPDRLFKRKANWWRVDSAGVLGNPIEGWVREFNHDGGRVTCEFAQKWIDFKCIEGACDPAHTIFATTRDWIDYASHAEVAAAASRSKLSPLMLSVYDALFTKGDGRQAADELCTLSRTERGGYPWLMQAASRLIVKHESEWANPSKWKQLASELEKQTGPKPQHEEEQKRIEKLAWWDEVKAGVPGFPGAEVFHIHPVSLVANFEVRSQLSCIHCGVTLTVTSKILKSIFSGITDDDADGFAPELNSAFEKYDINTCHRVAHFFGQCEVECTGFTRFHENLRYTDGNRLWNTYRSALTAGLRRLYPTWSQLQIEQYAKSNLIKNDSELGIVLFGDASNPSVDYRGRGLLHLTWHENYERYKISSGIDVVSDPLKVENDRHIATESSVWYWSTHFISQSADVNDVKGVTRKINPALKELNRRGDAAKRAFTIVNQGCSPCKLKWDSTLNGEQG
ncbi:glycoside hydrolase family 19 protein [Trinickia violacea]|uniref:Glycoside hydrolase family 19 protein n=1 Tax=Trinickia violacea TaxID=2571746 RepID=A0A4P8IQJ1_9BURK|nr:glycoside hydrolase family 19 protein [Trinickia violacea]QCP51348.1 glycoside hydrolase family 19 protein [Trinickia violacea]